MTIDQKDFMHGAALVAIADSKAFTALNKSGRKYGHYVVNHDRELLIKYAARRRADFSYLFTFSPHDVALIDVLRNRRHAFVVFVCGRETVTALSIEELDATTNLALPSQAISIHAEPRKQLRFYGGVGQVGPVPRQRFPQNVLA